MRIHLPLEPRHFTSNPSGPLAKIGGDLVLIELQGQIEVEGDKANSVIGVLGLDRPDHPTLHIGRHHLLHGKMATLPRPYAVIRRAAAAPSAANIEGDAEDEESDAEREALSSPVQPKKAKLSSTAAPAIDEQEDDDPPLFPEAMTTPSRGPRDLPPSSPPVAPSSAGPGYSSDLSSPVRDMDAWGFPRRTGDDEEDEDEEERREREEEMKRKRRRAERGPRQRARHYEVVAVVRKKIVFSLRPEPLVAATELPE